MNALVEIRQLALQLGAFRLGPVDLELERGDYFVLMGPSGCGKTSLLRAIAGVYPHHDGDLRLAGESVKGRPPHARGVGFVSQTASLFPHLDVRRNLEFGLRYRPGGVAGARERFDRLVSLIGLSHLLARRPANLSGGESRRVALARALLVEPRVLLLDEPLSMLDTNARTELLAVLQRLHDDLQTVTIHVTHHWEEAWGVAARCAVMRAGRLAQVGEVHELFRRPRTRFVAEFLGGRNLFRGRIADGRADLGFAELPLAAPPEAEASWLQLRPEELALCSVAAGQFGGRLRELRDRGAYVELLLGLPGGQELIVHLASRAELPAPGTEVGVRCLAPPVPLQEDAS